ncbi:O-antigen ligase family protein [Allosphingosinicella flava]|uniref:O-antigen ligase family protein n=1 Tax=Allosphingosinicella flava TaxID=2771430 RepID=A0A7T2GIC0_9SPHN|nr:O-antigen ligase family protein [Sphingosinicella flava]QPQ54419.1 O-antigen ligase family protein [Sphingosinicella flava]
MSIRAIYPWAKFSLSLTLLIALLAGLWIAGGASRPDVFAQVVVRGIAWFLLLVAIIFVRRSFPAEAMPVIIILAAALAMILLQLVPLPPEVWLALPGRTVFADAAEFSRQGQPWRPLSIVPDATINSASSLVVPIAVLLFAANVTRAERRLMPAIILFLVFGHAFVGFLQFSGIDFKFRLINDVGGVSGLFANRNHFALLMSIGCLVAPVWAFQDSAKIGFRSPIAVALILLCILIILGSGSRSGLMLGLVGAMLGFIIIRSSVRRILKPAPRWVIPALMAGILALVATFVLVSIAADRAASVDRVVALSAEEEVRFNVLPVIWDVALHYFPAGAGHGSFDSIYRLHEPYTYLKSTYLNHAHNDFLEVVLEGGVGGLLVLTGALAWWGLASIRVWRAPSSSEIRLGRFGAALLLLILIASAIDYPARTPLIMAVAVLGALCLNWGVNAARSPLPAPSQHL